MVATRTGFDITGEKNLPERPVEETFEHEDAWILSLAAGIERQNYMSAWVNNKIRGVAIPDFVYDHNYDPIEDKENWGYDPTQVGRARSADEAAYIRAALDREHAQLKLINGNSWGMVGEIAGGIFQPHVLVGGAVPNIGWKAVAMVEGGLEVGSEVLLHNMQRTRTMQESLLNVASVTAGTAILGKAAEYSASIPDKKAWSNDKPEVDDLGAGDNLADSVGAARAVSSAEDSEMVGAAGLENLAVGPAARLTKSPSGLARALSDELTDKSFYTKGMERGNTTGVSVEALVHARQGEVITVLDDVQQLQKQSSMSPHDFDMQLGIALSNGGRHANAQIVEAAERIRLGIFEPRKQELIDSGMEIGKTRYANTYFPRIYDRNAIVDNYGDLKQALVRHYQRAIEEDKLAQASKAGDNEARLAQIASRVQENLDKIEKLSKAKDPDVRQIARLKRANARYEKTKASMKPKAKSKADVKAAAAARVRVQNRVRQEAAAEAETAASDTIQNMLGGLPIGHRVMGAGAPSALKRRTVALTDKMLEPYLDKRASVVIGKYTSAIDPYLIMQERFGDDMIVDRLRAVGNEYQQLIDGAKTAAERKKLTKKRDSDLKDLEQMRDRILMRVQRSVDPSSTVEKIVQRTKVYNMATQLGGIALSSTPDLARPLMAYGLRSYSKGLAKGLTGFFKSLAGVPDTQIRRMGIAVQRTQNSRLQEMAELGEPGDRVTAAVQRMWGKFTLFDHWTDAMESIAAQSAMDWTLRQASKVASAQPLGRSARMKIARMGFDESDLKRFHEAATRTGGAGDKNLKYADTLEWGDMELAKLFEAGIGSDVRRSIVRVGMGDKPLAMDNSIVSLIFQYQSFAIAATNRMLIAGLQQRDAALLQGILVSLSLGALVGGTKAWLRGEDPTKWEPDKYLLEGIDRSGMLGLYNMGFNWIRAGMGDTPSRYIHRGVEGVLGGPTISQFGRAARMVTDAAEGDFEGAGEQAMRLTPLVSNTLHMRQLMQQLGED